MVTNDQFQNLLNNEMFIGIPTSGDVGDKFALIGMICYLKHVLSQQKSGITHYQVIRMCVKNQPTSDLLIESLANVCDWFAYQCTKFQDFGVKPKEMPAKIANLIFNMLPF